MKVAMYYNNNDVRIEEMPIPEINDKELLRSIVKAQKDPRKTYAREVMTTPVMTVNAEEPLMEALKTIKDKGIERLVIMRKGKLVGMLAGSPTRQA